MRLMYGNGLKAAIWKRFTDRFGIENIAEFYGSTEGNCSTIQLENRPGAVGSLFVWFPQFLSDLLYPLGLVKVDKETGEPIRGPDGLCVRAQAGESRRFQFFLLNTRYTYVRTSLIN